MKDNGSKNKGLHEKYVVTKNGFRVESAFILEPQDDKAAREALRTYADCTENSELAKDLRNWVNELENGDK